MALQGLEEPELRFLGWPLRDIAVGTAEEAAPTLHSPNKSDEDSDAPWQEWQRDLTTKAEMGQVVRDAPWAAEVNTGKGWSTAVKL